MNIALNVSYVVFFLTTAVVIAGCLPSEIAREYGLESTPPPWMDYPWLGATVSGAAAITLAFLALQPLYAAALTYAMCATWTVACFRIERGWGGEERSYLAESCVHILAPFALASDIFWWAVRLVIRAFHAFPGLDARNPGGHAK